MNINFTHGYIIIQQLSSHCVTSGLSWIVIMVDSHHLSCHNSQQPPLHVQSERTGIMDDRPHLLRYSDYTGRRSFTFSMPSRLDIKIVFPVTSSSGSTESLWWHLHHLLWLTITLDVIMVNSHHCLYNDQQSHASSGSTESLWWHLHIYYGWQSP